MLETLKNQIVRDIMHLVAGRTNKVSVGVDKLSYSDLDHLEIEEEKIDSAYLLYSYPWRKKIDVTDLDQNEREWATENPEIDVSVAIIYDDARKNYNVSGGSIPLDLRSVLISSLSFLAVGERKTFKLSRQSLETLCCMN